MAATNLFVPLTWAVLRAPLLPVEAYPIAESLPASFSARCEPRLRSAIAGASPDLHDALARAGHNGGESARVASTLRRYQIRAATRPTPYGLFAGVSLVRWGEATDLRLASTEPRTRSRPDMEWLSGLVSDLERDPEVRRCVRLVANPSVLLRAGRAFVLLTGPDGATVRISLRATAPVRRALELARTPVQYEALAAELVASTGAPRAKVDGLLNELCDNDLLYTDLRPALTGGDPARRLLARLMHVAPAAPAAELLEERLRALDRWDARPIRVRGQSVERMEGGSTRHRFDTDMALPLAGNRIHPAVAGDAAIAAELLARLSTRPDGPTQLSAYREAFLSKYGEDRPVPLLELLDPQFGLGPPSHELGATEHGRDEALVAVAQQALDDRRLVVELDDDLLARLQTWRPRLDAAPRSLDISVFVAAQSAAALDAGAYVLVVGGFAGAAAGRTAGRFADLVGEGALEALREAACAEERNEPGSMHVELVYMPLDAGAANIAIRPAVRSHEIVMGALPGVPWDRVIRLDELVVTLEDARFHVRRAGVDTDIVATQGHMLSPLLMPPVARFLLDLAADGRVQPGPFDWGAAASFPLLPRLARGRIVLSLARWLIPPRLLAEESPGAFHAAVAAWRDRWAVPRRVYLAELDNRLLLDLDDVGCTAILHEELARARGALVLQEAFPGPEHAWLSGPDGHHLIELAIPLVARPVNHVDSASKRRSPGSAPASGRLRTPGSDWLFMALDCPSPFQDDVISGPLLELTRFAGSASLIDSWFFVRYVGPAPQLRIRFHGEPDALLGPLLRQLCAWAQRLVVRGMSEHFALDTYEREIERYGGPEGVQLAEAVFAADSEAVARLLALDGGAADRIALAVVSIDDLLATIGLDRRERRAWYASHGSLSRADGAEYRKRKHDLRRLLSSTHDVDVADILGGRRAALAPIAKQLQSLDRSQALGRPRDDLCASYVHMHCNRLFSVDSRASETLALALLRRTSQSLEAMPASG